MIYVTGDMHGDVERLYSKEFKMLEEDDTVIVAGDFGFVWDGSKKEQKLLKYLGSRKFNVCFIDGPHDNYDRIYSCRETVWKGGRVHRISGTLFHLCRGQVFTIEDCTIFTFGGGESSDKDIRTENQIWFREELPTPAQMEEGAQVLDTFGDKVDFVITHEPPSIVKRALQQRAGNVIYTNKLNGYLEELNKNVDFAQWYFGSFHEDRVVTPKHTAVFLKMIPINADDYEVDDDYEVNDYDVPIEENELDNFVGEDSDDYDDYYDEDYDEEYDDDSSYDVIEDTDESTDVEENDESDTKDGE